MEDIGKSIREIRKSKKISMQVLANEIGVAVQTIQKYETGIIEDIPLKNLQKIAQVLNVELYELLGMDKEIENIKAVYDIIENELFKLDNTTKIKLLKECNTYYYNNIDFFEDLAINGILFMNYNYNLPLNEQNKDKDILDFAYKNNIINFDFLNSIKDKEKINISNHTENISLKLSQNKNIQNLQKEIIDITTKIDNVEIIEDIRDIAKLKLDKTKNNHK